MKMSSEAVKILKQSDKGPTFICFAPKTPEQCG
jgi:hypothetical protein